MLRNQSAWKYVSECLLVACLLLMACSSDRVAGPEDGETVLPSEGTVSKISISTDYNSPMPTTTILFEVALPGYVFIEITNATGYHVKTLVDGVFDAGAHTVQWDGTTDEGKPIEPGIYMLHLAGPDGGIWSPIVYLEP